MKILYIMFFLICASCSNEFKAKQLVKTYLKESLHNYKIHFNHDVSEIIVIGRKCQLLFCANQNSYVNANISMFAKRTNRK